MPEKIDYTPWLKSGETLETVSQETLKKRRQRQVSRAEKEAAALASAREAATKPQENEIKIEDAAYILSTERGIQNQHVIDTVVNLVMVAARLNNITFGASLFRNGLRSDLTNTPLPEITSDEVVPAEILHRTDLYALYDAGFWRHPDVTFDHWLADRLRFKSDAFELSKLLGKEDFGDKHREWTDFAPRWNPIGLGPVYTQRELHTWLDQQSATKKYLLVASRNSMKSTWARIFGLTLTLVAPDARVLIVSETHKLSKKSIKEFRGYFEVTSQYNPTMFQQYFAEYTIVAGASNSLVYDNPLAHLGLPQSACSSSSMEGANAGERCELLLYDDPVSNENGTANEEQRTEAILKYGAIGKLLEPSGYAFTVMTPWREGDVGWDLIKRNDEDPEHPLAVRIDPIFDIKPEASKKALLELTEDDVVLNFLPKLNWKFVRGEMRNPGGLNFFITQNLCRWIPDDESLIKVSFDENVLRHATKPSAFFATSELIQTVIVVDPAFSVSRYADFSAIGTFQLRQRDGKKFVVMADMKLERMRMSELATAIVDMSSKAATPVRSIVIEKIATWRDFDTSIKKAALLRGHALPHISWKTIANGATGGIPMAQKARRIKNLEEPIVSSEFFFQSGPFIDATYDQFTKFDGVTKSNNYRKDDVPDCCALAWEYLGGAHMNNKLPRTEEQERIEDEAQQEVLRKAHYERLFENKQSQVPNFFPAAPGQPSVGNRFAQYSRGRSAALRNRGR